MVRSLYDMNETKMKSVLLGGAPVVVPYSGAAVQISEVWEPGVLGNMAFHIYVFCGAFSEDPDVPPPSYQPPVAELWGSVDDGETYIYWGKQFELTNPDELYGVSGCVGNGSDPQYWLPLPPKCQLRVNPQGGVGVTVTGVRVLQQGE